MCQDEFVSKDPADKKETWLSFNIELHINIYTEWLQRPSAPGLTP